MAFNLQAVLQTEVIDKLLVVMKAGDTALAEQMAGLGTRVGSANTFAELPTVDQNGKAVTTGDTAVLTTADGTHPAGIYSRKPDNSGWNDVPDINYDEMGINNILQDFKAPTNSLDFGDATEPLANSSIDNRFVTPSVVAGWLLTYHNKMKDFNNETYHPKGGDATLKVVGADADENTQEFVTANQLKATFTQADIQAKYDAL